MPKQRFGLGRGLDALIPGSGSYPGASAVSDETPMDTNLPNAALFEAPVTAITPNPQQPRMPLGDDEQLLELAASIQEFGLLQPLLVTLEDDDDEHPRYQLIAGERRWRAAQIAGLERVPVIIRDATPQLMLEMALVENLQRTDLNPLEEAQGYRMLVEDYQLTQEQVADRVGRKRTTVANTLRLLQLPDAVREALVTMPMAFTEGHARAVLQINGETERVDAMKQIIAQGLSVRQAEELARRYNAVALRLTPDRRGARVHQQTYETRQLEEEFTQAIEMKVRLQRNTKGKGSLTLFFSNEDQLQRLYDRLVAQAVLANGNDGLGFANSGVQGLLDSIVGPSFVTERGGDDSGGEN